MNIEHSGSYRTACSTYGRLIAHLSDYSLITMASTKNQSSDSLTALANQSAQSIKTKLLSLMYRQTWSIQ